MKIKYIILSFLMLFFLAGCTENNSEVGTEEMATEISDVNTTVSDTTTQEPTTPIVTVLVDETPKIITQNGEQINIDVTVIDENNNPYESGNVKVVYPDDVRSGRDIGSFSSSTVAVKNGKASFSYTAPYSLKDNTTDLVFKFYHDSKSGNIASYTLKIEPSDNQMSLTNYTISSNISSDTATMGLGSSKLVSFYVKDEDGNLIDDSRMTSMLITILNPNIGMIEDKPDSLVSSLVAEKKASATVNIKSNKLSGIIPFKVEVSFKDENDIVQNISSTFNILVLSGPPSAISLSYSRTLTESAPVIGGSLSGEDTTQYMEARKRAKFIEKWIVTVTDRYNNLVNTNPSISMGMIAGFAKSSSTTKPNEGNYLYYLPIEGNGTIYESNSTFVAKKNVFANVDDTNDILVTFGNGYTFDASGKWDISKTESNNTLNLVDNYTGQNTSELGFAVGHNYRQDGNLEGVEWVANVYPQDNNYIVDDSGSVTINVEYDYYMTGKDVVLWVNLIGKNYFDDTTVRIGEAKKITLSGNGIEPEDNPCSILAGETKKCKFCAKITNTLQQYRYARFIATEPVGSEYIVNNGIVSSPKITEDTSCITYNLTNTDLFPTSVNSGTMTILSEF